MSASVDILRRARARIADPAHWTTGALARTSPDGPLGSDLLDPNDPAATCWCALGAVRAEGGKEGGYEEEALYNALPVGGPWDDDDPEPVADYNDRHATHADIMALFDRAIAAVGVRS